MVLVSDRVLRNAAVCERSTRAFTVTTIPCLWSIGAGPRHLYQRAAHTNLAQRSLITQPRHLHRIAPASPQTAHLITLPAGVISALLLSSDEKQYRVVIPAYARSRSPRAFKPIPFGTNSMSGYPDSAFSCEKVANFYQPTIFARLDIVNVNCETTL